MERSDHVEAAISALEWFIAQLRAGTPPEELGSLLAVIARLLERRT